MRNRGVSSLSSQGAVGLGVLAVFIIIFSGFSASAQGTFQIGIGTKGYERGSALRQLADGGFIIGGYTESYGLKESDMLLVRTDASGNVAWIQSYGGPEREVINDMAETPDGGIIAASEKYQPDRKEGEFLTLLKTDASGNLLWKKIFDEGGNETEGFSIAPTADGNYVITGIVKSMNIVSDAFFTMRGEDQSVFLLKIDGNGNKIWSRRLNSSPDYISSTGVSVITARDGSYLITGNVTKKGRTDSKLEKPMDAVNEDDRRNMLLVKIKPDGTLEWAKEYGGGKFVAGMSVTEKREGGFAVTGVCTPSNGNPADADFFIASLDAAGNVQWSKTYGGQKFDSAADILQAPDGGFVISGDTKSFGSGESDELVFKTDNSGNLVWAKTYGGSNAEYGARLALVRDGIVITGEGSIGMESFDVLLVKMDSNGNSGCWGVGAPLSVNTFQLTATVIEKAASVGVEQGITPPNFKKADVNNIIGQSREKRVIKICEH